MIGPMPYVAVQGMIGEGFPAGRLNYWKSSLLREIGDGIIEALADFACRVPSPLTRRRHRRHPWRLRPGCFRRHCLRAPRPALRPGDPVQLDRSGRDRGQHHLDAGALRRGAPVHGGGVYVNDLDRDEGQERVREAYGANYARLAEVKQRWDPDNVFHTNHNIVPAS